MKTPWNVHQLKVRDNSPKLPRSRSKKFHTFTAQRLFLCMYGRPDISPEIAYLTKRVRGHNEDVREKLVRLMKYLKTKND